MHEEKEGSQAYKIQYSAKPIREQTMLDIMNIESQLINDFIVKNVFGKSDDSMVKFHICLNSEKLCLNLK